MFLLAFSGLDGRKISAIIISVGKARDRADLIFILTSESVWTWRMFKLSGSETISTLKDACLRQPGLQVMIHPIANKDSDRLHQMVGSSDFSGDASNYVVGHCGVFCSASELCHGSR